MAVDLATAELPGLDQGALTAPVRRLLDSPTAELQDDWRAERLAYVELNPISGGLYRVSGTARLDGVGSAPVPWSLILKIARRPQAGSLGPLGNVLDVDYGRHPSHPDYWQREVLAYQSGLLADLTGGLIAPRCLGVTEQPSDVCWLWLEEVVGLAGPDWPLERYALAAQHLGRFNGTFLERRGALNAPWLSESWLRGWASKRAKAFDPVFVLADTTWSHPLVRQVFPLPVGPAIVRLWAEEEQLLAIYDQLPQTLCHLDLYSRNLFARHLNGVEQTVAVDWAFVGMSALGGDAGQLAVASALFGDVPAARLADFWELVLEGYAAGLRDAGWHGDPRLVRLGAAIMGSVRFGYFIGMMTLRAAVDERALLAASHRFGRPPAELLTERAGAICFCLERAEEARVLADALGLGGR